MNEGVETYILNQDEKFTKLLFLLRSIIVDIDSRIVETIKYKIPFYIYKKNICYINVVNDKYVDLGFVDGFELPDTYNKLISGNDRNTVKSLRYFSITDLEESVVRATLLEVIDFQT